MKKTLLTGIAALLLTMGTAHTMPHDLSNTWCASHIPRSAMIDRETYYRWIKNCHRRRGIQPCWGLVGALADLNQCGTNAKRRDDLGVVPLPKSDPRELSGKLR